MTGAGFTAGHGRRGSRAPAAASRAWLLAAIALVLGIALLVAAGNVRAADSNAASSTLEQALAAYAAAQDTASAADRPAAFARAERLFAAAAQQGGAGADLWTDLGTSALQAEHLGTAILAYRRALAIDPDDHHAQQDLLHTRTLLPAWVPKPETGGFLDSILAWQHSMSAAERRGAAALAFAVAAVMLGAALATASSALRILAVFPFLVWGLLIGSVAFVRQERAAVLTAPDTVARAADSRNAPARFAEPLPAGTEVTVAETRGAWARVILADGRDAWVASSATEPVEPESAAADSRAAHL
ncbi:MAG TPA: SH3 domain-containing protein [Candidatus Binatia bacterium]|jgi:tetratricopeptide (TPR) repeat protein